MHIEHFHATHLLISMYRSTKLWAVLVEGCTLSSCKTWVDNVTPSEQAGLHMIGERACATACSHANKTLKQARYHLNSSFWLCHRQRSMKPLLQAFLFTHRYLKCDKAASLSLLQISCLQTL